jgi:lipopolysaccharide biosynthesis regulator YciM
MSANYHLQPGDKATFVSNLTNRKTHVLIISAERYPDGEAIRYTARALDDANAPAVTKSATQFHDYDPTADTRDPKIIIAELKAKMAGKKIVQTYRYVCLSCGMKTNRHMCQCGGDTILNTAADGDPTVVLDH